MMLTRCNRRLIALPFPTVALLAANAACTHFCISRAYCFHPSRSLVRNHRHRLHTTTTVNSRRQQYRAATPHYFRLLERTQNYSALSTWGAQQKTISLRPRRRAATGRLHHVGGNNDECDDYDQIILSSVRDSLWYDLIKPHLCSSRLRRASYSSSSHES
jgi:hypothetical protein